MKAKVVRIGNSQGIRIPKTVLEQCRLRDVVELDVQEGQLVIRNLSAPRRGWEDAFRQMHQHADDVLLDETSATSTQWDRSEWKW
jgi:antitoxin MazE